MQKEFFSKTYINEYVEFVPAYKDIKRYGISSDPLIGTVVAVRFTQLKVFYDVLSTYYAIVFRDVPSEKIIYITSRSEDKPKEKIQKTSTEEAPAEKIDAAQQSITPYARLIDEQQETNSLLRELISRINNIIA